MDKYFEDVYYGNYVVWEIIADFGFEFMTPPLPPLSVENVAEYTNGRIEFNFSGYEGIEIPSIDAVNQFIQRKKIKIAETINRLTASEKVLYLDKLESDLSPEYWGLRKTMIKAIPLKVICELFPERRTKEQILLTPEQQTMLADKYTLWPAFQMVKNELREYVKRFRVTQQVENEVTKDIPVLPNIKPVISPEYIDAIFEILKDFFLEEKQLLFKEILHSGNDSDTKLIFLGSGNRWLMLSNSLSNLI